jgi:hypothetical protein
VFGSQIHLVSVDRQEDTPPGVDIQEMVRRVLPAGEKSAPAAFKQRHLDMASAFITGRRPHCLVERKVSRSPDGGLKIAMNHSPGCPLNQVALFQLKQDHGYNWGAPPTASRVDLSKPDDFLTAIEDLDLE